MVFGRGAFMALARDHYENFPVGSFLVPARLRPHLHRIYAFARTADDIADELKDPAMLASYHQEFVDHLGGRAEHVPLFVDLRASIREHDLPEQLFLDLIDAFTQDLTVGRYDEAGLFDYCRRSADPVGRLVLRVFGHRDAELDRLSDRICTALQLLNHLRDIRSDLIERDRIYFPREDLERFGVAESDLRAERATPGVRELVGHWAGRTAGMFREGWPLTRAVEGRLRLELRAILCGAASVLGALRARDYDVLAHRVRLGRWTKMRALLRALTSHHTPREFE